MIYLTYEEYKSIGGICDESAFNRFVVRACGIIDNATQNRITSDLLKDVAVAEFTVKYGENVIDIPIDEITSSVDVRIKACCRDLIEYLSTNNEMQRQLSGESYSEGAITQSFSYATKSNEDGNAEVNRLLDDYLSGITTSAGVSLLYKGAAY